MYYEITAQLLAIPNIPYEECFFTEMWTCGVEKPLISLASLMASGKIFSTNLCCILTVNLLCATYDSLKAFCSRYKQRTRKDLVLTTVMTEKYFTETAIAH